SDPVPGATPTRGRGVARGADGPGGALREAVQHAGIRIHGPACGAGRGCRRGRSTDHLEAGALSEAVSVYEAAGGEETFRKLVDRFYAGVAGDPLLRPLHPEDPTLFRAPGQHLPPFLHPDWGAPTLAAH